VLVAGTKQIILWIPVIVLPWHDSIRVAEGIALPDILSGGSRQRRLAQPQLPPGTRNVAGTLERD
jgi:hypothetical protein